DLASVVQQTVSTAAGGESVVSEFISGSGAFTDRGVAGNHDCATDSARQAECLRSRRAAVALKTLSIESDCLSKTDRELLGQGSVFRNWCDLSDCDFFRASDRRRVKTRVDGHARISRLCFVCECTRLWRHTDSRRAVLR